MTRQEAEDYLAGKNTVKSDASDKFYAVARGKDGPAVYTEWTDVQAQISNFQNPRYKKFTSEADALEWIAENKDGSMKVNAPSTEETESAMVEEVGEEVDGPPRKRAKTGTKDGKSTSESGVGHMEVWTDGSSLGNGKHGAQAGLGVFFGVNDPRNVSERVPGPRQTNQRGELLAIQRALEIVPVDHDVTISTDSKYSIDCCTKWFRSWIKNGWKTSTSKDVNNKDIIQTILDLIQKRESQKSKTHLLWVKGHAADVGNNAADKLAVAGARKPMTTS